MKRALLLLMPLALAACERAGADRAGQVLATVNGVEISLAHGGGAAVQPALEKLIDRELLVQRALAEGLERDPKVAESLDAARRQVLAQAYLERLSRAARKPTREEVRAFYAENPDLFAARRIYHVARAQPAEDVPLAWLPKLSRMYAGEVAMLGAAAVQLVKVEEAPLSEAEAAPRIEEFLAGRARLEIAAAEIRRLREGARIEYAAQFKR